MKKHLTLIVTVAILLFSVNLFSQNGLGTTCKKGVTKKYHGNGQLKSIGKKKKDCTNIGVWKWYYKNGRLEAFETYDKKGDAKGLWKEYYENGQLAFIGYYKDDEKTGTWKYYSKEGKLVKTKKY